jgi:amidophosphoribosyltransferase
VGRKDGAYCVSFESFAYINLGYKFERELGPGEIVFLEADKITQIKKPGAEMRVCSFLWTYYGYPTSGYEGVNVEEMRYRCGRSLAMQDRESGLALDIDYVAGVPDSGTAHAIGYSNSSGVPFSRPLIKYTPTWPRSFMPQDQNIRDLIARMKLVSIDALIENKRLMFIDDSIVRGTQMRGIVDFLYECNVKELHLRTACPPIAFGCKYLNFSRSAIGSEPITHRVIREFEGSCGDEVIAEYTEYGSMKYNKMIEEIRKILNLTTLAYHSLHGLLDSIGIDKCKLCTYCWNGQE